MNAPRSGCPINLTVEALGDRWSLIVIRDLMFGKAPYACAFAGRGEGDYFASRDNDPYVFFRKTYLTHRLRRLLIEVHEKLTTGKGPSVVELCWDWTLTRPLENACA